MTEPAGVSGETALGLDSAVGDPLQREQPLSAIGSWFAETLASRDGSAPRFASRAGTLSFGFENGAVVIEVVGAEQSASLRHSFVGAPDVAPEGVGAQGPTLNYFLGVDPNEWRTGLRSFGALTYSDVWPGVDIVYRMAERGMKYDVLVDAGADLESARFRVEGASQISLTSEGELWIATGAGVVADAAPIGLQDGRRVACTYALHSEREYGFQCHGYDPTRPLAVDPYVFSTFLGGDSGDAATDVQITPTGEVVVLGITDSPNFPASAGAYNETRAGGVDAFVAEFSAAGDSLLWATYLGGSGDDLALRLELGPGGALFLAGGTTSLDFPTTAGVVGPTAADAANGFVVRLNASGSALDYSTLVGADFADLVRDLAVASDGTVFVTGSTASPNFTTTTGAYNRVYNGTAGVAPSESFLSQLSATAASYLWSTFIAAPRGETAYLVALDPIQQPVVASASGASMASLTTSGAYQRNYGGGGTDTLLQKFSADGSGMLWATLLGGSGFDSPTGLAIDTSGFIFVSGRTDGGRFPTTAGAFQENATGYDDVFLSKVNASGDRLEFSTLVGGAEFDVPTDLTLDARGYATVVGYTYSFPFPTTPQSDIPTRPIGTVDGWPSTDGFALTLNQSGESLYYSTLVGGSEFDTPQGVAVDLSGVITVVGETGSPDFTNTSSAYDRSYAGLSDGFVQQLRPPPMDFELGLTPSTIGLVQGTSSTVTLVAASVSEYVGPGLTVTVSGAPPGLTAGCPFSPVPVATTCPFVVSATAQLPIGTYNLTVSATNGTRVKSANLSVIVVLAADFLVGLNASVVSVVQGTSSAVGVTMQTIGPYNGSLIEVRATTAGPWMTVGCTPTLVAPGSGCTLQVTVAQSAPLGTYEVAVTGFNGSATRSAFLNVTVLPAPDFVLRPSVASVTVARGSSVAFVVDVEGVGGYAGPPVGFWGVVGDPRITGSCSPSVVDAGGACTFALVVNASMPLGVHSVQVQASNGTVTREVTLSVEVVRPADFELTLDRPAVQVLLEQPTAVNLTVTGLFGYSGAPVDVTVEGAPAGFVWGCSPSTVTPPGSCVLTLEAGRTVLDGNYYLSVVGNNGTAMRSTPLTVSVSRPPESLTMQLESTALELYAGDTHVLLVTLTGAPYFGGLVTVRLVGGAPDFTGVCSPRDVAPTGTCQLTLTVAAGAAPGTRVLTVEGFNGTSTLTSTLTVTVLPPPPQPDFSIAVSPSSIALLAGATGNVTLSVTPINGYSNDSLSVGAVAPAGIQVRCLSGSVAAGGTCMLRVTVGPTVPAGEYSVDVRVFDTLRQRNVTLLVTVESPPAPSPDEGGRLSVFVLAGVFVALGAAAAVVAYLWGRKRRAGPKAAQAPVPRVLTPEEAAEAKRQEEYARLYGKSR